MKQPMEDQRREYRFGGLRFIPDRQLLLYHGTPVPIGSRAMDILGLLVERAGEVVTKQELKDHAWPGTHLHDSNLKVNISMLRRSLPRGEGDPEYIGTVTGRGYRFVAPVQVVEASSDYRLDAVRPPSGDLPLIPEVIGRADIIQDLQAKILETGFVTIVGPAGVGKTTLAVATARALTQALSDGARFVDLATIDDAQLVGSLIALAVGVEGDATDVLSGLVDALDGKEMLLVLDNCEHVLGAVTVVAEHLHKNVPSVRILATSREAMRTRSETIVRLAPLECPDPDPMMSATQAKTYPAVALFVRRAEEAHGYQLTDADAPIVAQICRRLDGIALAMELAAPKLGDSDPATLLALLEQSFEPLNLGAPTGNPRHQTLLATLGWSYRLLSRDEARLFRTLSVFCGTFTIEDILGITADGSTGVDEIAAWTDGLVAKSLLSATYRLGGARYRLLDSTRSFAAGELQTRGEADHVHLRYARYQLTVFERAEAEWAWRDRKDWTASYAPHANDVRKAIDWAFNGHGDLELGIRLTVAAIPLWDELSTVGVSQIRVERALKAWKESGLGDSVLKMKLVASYGAALNFSENLGAEADATWAEGYDLAVAVGDVDYQLRALWGQAVLQSFSGRHRLALMTLARFLDLADRENDREAIPDGKRLMLMTRFYVGEIRDAEEGLSALEREHASVGVQSRVARFQVDRLVGIRVGLAKVTWVRGDQRRAMSMVQSALERAAELAHRVTQSNALAQIALPLSLQIGDLKSARQHVEILAYNLSLHETTIWRPVCRFYQAAISCAEGEASALPEMAAAIEELFHNNFLIRVPMYLNMYAEAALNLDRIDEARSALARAFDLVRRQDETWCLPEIHRLNGRVRWRDGDLAAAEKTLSAAAEYAAASGARTIELRAVTSLAELLMAQDRRVDATLRLAPVYAHFDAGFQSKDIENAGRLLEELTGGGA